MQHDNQPSAVRRDIQLISGIAGSPELLKKENNFPSMRDGHPI
jgi:hypothetical protein